MKSLLLLPALLFLLPASAASWRFVSKVEELPVEITDRLEITRPKVRLCGGDSEESTDCVLCTVCHPHEYELIGCSGQMDSVCANCATGWTRNTPKTVDFFRKCKKHPLLPLLFPDAPFEIKLESSMFADQEKMLQDAENTETAELSEEASDEDYEGEDEEVETVREEEDESQELGVKPVDVDESDDDSHQWTSYEKADRESAMEKESEEPTDEEFASDDVSGSVEDEDSAEVKDEEIADPFDTKNDKGAEAVDDADEDEDDSEEGSHRLYPLHKASIWRIIGPEIRPVDDEDLDRNVRKAILERKKTWQLEKEIQRIRNAQKGIRVESIEILEDYNDVRQTVKGGFRPLPVRTYYVYSTENLFQTRPLLVLCWALFFAILAASIVLSVRICMVRRRNRVMVLPEMDDMSRLLINEAHARVHSKKDKMPKPEFV